MAETKTPDPTTGRIVQYVLSDADVDRIMNERDLYPNLAYGNRPHVGDTVPLIVVRPIGDERHVSGHVFLDGPQHLWIADAAEGERSGEWQYPAKV